MDNPFRNLYRTPCELYRELGKVFWLGKQTKVIDQGNMGLGKCYEGT